MITILIFGCGLAIGIMVGVLLSLQYAADLEDEMRK